MNWKGIMAIDKEEDEEEGMETRNEDFQDAHAHMKL